MNQDLMKTIVWPALGIVLVVCEMALVRAPANQKAAKLNEELDILRGQTQKGVPEARIAAMERAVDSLSAVLQDVKDRLYPAAAFSELGKAVEKSGRSLNLKLVDIKPDYSGLDALHDSKEDVIELPVTLTLRGGFMQFARFLEQLSNFPYIKAVEVAVRPAVDDQNAVDGVIYGTVIFKKEPESSGTVQTDAKPSDKSAASA